MTKRIPTRGSRHGRHVDGLAGALVSALSRRDARPGAAAILIGTRPMHGAQDGGSFEVICGVRDGRPSTISQLTLLAEEQGVVDRILADQIAGPAAKRWTDIVVTIQLVPTGVSVAAIPRDSSWMKDAESVRNREAFVEASPLARITTMFGMAGIR